MNRLILSLSLVVTADALADGAHRTVSLVDALGHADVNVPALRVAQASSELSRAQADEVRAPLLPQLNGTASWQRTTSNFIQRPGAIPNTIAITGGSTGATYNFFSFGLTLSQTLFDGPTFARWRAALGNLEATRAAEATARLDAALNVRVAFFNAKAQLALVDVARETLANQKRHLDQVKGFVQVGTRPEIDLAQARTDVANAQVALITAENNYAVSKATLNQAMGIESDTEYELGDGSAPPVDVEDATIGEQADLAKKTRPELLVFEKQLRAQALTIAANKLGYAPVAAAESQVSAGGGVQLDQLGWNWYLKVGLTWNLFGGLLTYSQVKEAEAQLKVLGAQRDAALLQVRLELEKGRLAVRAAKATLVAANDALENARVLKTLAEGRYRAGVGNAIELSDAVLALANAGGQQVQADFNVAVARAQLMRALGRR